jgi:hypothetical protein
LGWKLAVQGRNLGGAPDKDAHLRIVQFLSRQHFNVDASGPLRDGEPTIRASAGACRLLIVKTTSEGWDRAMVGRYATLDDTVFIVFMGRVYTEQPKWLALIDALWVKVRSQMGLPVDVMPLFTVIAAKSCDAQHLPWNELG